MIISLLLSSLPVYGSSGFSNITQDYWKIDALDLGIGYTSFVRPGHKGLSASIGIDMVSVSVNSNDKEVSPSGSALLMAISLLTGYRFEISKHFLINLLIGTVWFLGGRMELTGKEETLTYEGFRGPPL